MDSRPSLDDLARRWHELRQLGQTLSLQELCAGSAEQAEDVRERLRAVAAMESFLGLTPDAGGSSASQFATPVDQRGETSQPEPRARGERLPGGIPGYEVLRELGRGGMGVVYQARQVKLDRVVALKMILAGEYAGADERRRFQTEAEAVARLQHPNIVQIHEVGEHDDHPFFSLEFCPGGSLADKLAGTPLPPSEAARLVEVLARAVQAAHDAGIVHRDLKPGNVLLLADGTPKLTDFGLAKKLDTAAGLTDPGAVVGTPSYMAPEQARGTPGEVGPAADVYALGAILYECLTGRPPFKAATALDTLAQVLAEDPVPPGRLLPGLPRDLETVCLKCLQKERQRRYATAADLAEDLRRFQAGEVIRARPVGAAERGWKWVRRNPVVAGLATVVAAALLLAVLALTVGLVAVNAERARTAAANAQLLLEQDRTQAAYQAEARRRRQAREALDALSSEVVDDWLTRQKQLTEPQKEFLNKALASYEEFARDTGDSEEARTGVAGAYLRVGKIRWRLGQSRQAEEAFRKGRELYARLAADFPGRGELREGLAQCQRGLGILLLSTRRLKGAEEAFRDAVAVFEPLAAEFPDRPGLRQNLAMVHINLANLFAMLRRFTEAEAEFRAALPIQEQLVAEFPGRPDFSSNLGGIQYNRATTFVQTGQWKQAETTTRAALAVEEPLVSRFPTRAEFHQVLAMEYGLLGLVLQHADRPAEAAEAYGKALPLVKQLANDFPGMPDYQNDVAHALGGLAQAILTKQPDRARQLLDEAGHYSQTALQATPGDINYLACFYENRVILVPVLLQLRDHAGAAEAADSVEPALHTPDALYDLARQYAYCVSLARQDPKVAEAARKELGKSYGDRAMNSLSRAIECGYRDLANLKKDPQLDPLRGREDFRKLLSDLERAESRAGTPSQARP